MVEIVEVMSTLGCPLRTLSRGLDRCFSATGMERSRVRVGVLSTTA